MVHRNYMKSKKFQTCLHPSTLTFIELLLGTVTVHDTALFMYESSSTARSPSIAGFTIICNGKRVYIPEPSLISSLHTTNLESKNCVDRWYSSDVNPLTIKGRLVIIVASGGNSLRASIVAFNGGTIVSEQFFVYSFGNCSESCLTTCNAYG